MKKIPIKVTLFAILAYLIIGVIIIALGGLSGFLVFAIYTIAGIAVWIHKATIKRNRKMLQLEMDKEERKEQVEKNYEKEQREEYEAVKKQYEIEKKLYEMEREEAKKEMERRENEIITIQNDYGDPKVEKYLVLLEKSKSQKSLE